MSNLEGKDRIKRDYLYRLWTSVDEALDLVRAASPLRRERERLRSGNVAARQLVGQCAGELTLEQLHIVTDTLQTAHSALVQAMLLVVIMGTADPKLGLAYVPAVVVQMRTPLELTKTALLSMAAAKQIELRIGTTASFARSDLAMAPKASDGSTLLWARVL